jgi:hypothetical protein
MKTITKNTILKQGEKTFQPVEVDGVIYWVGKEGFAIASSKLMTDDVPVISLEANNTRLIMEGKYPFDLKSYTKEDIEKAIELMDGVRLFHKAQHPFERSQQIKRILDQIDSISEIEVDENFNIISYK